MTDRTLTLVTSLADDWQEEPKPWDALSRECVPLDEAQDDTPERFLAGDGLSEYTGLDTVLGGEHNISLFNYGCALLEMDDDI